MAKNDNTRRIEAGSCSWCGHAPHGTAKCPANIQVELKNSKATMAPCPCNHTEHGLRGCAACQKATA